jgi:hypothetical protein
VLLENGADVQAKNNVSIARAIAHCPMAVSISLNHLHAECTLHTTTSRGCTYTHIFLAISQDGASELAPRLQHRGEYAPGPVRL